MIYAAYGSNMSRTRMLGRCPNARFLTKGIAEHFTLQFHYYADAISARNYELPVVLWDIRKMKYSGKLRLAREEYPFQRLFFRLFSGNALFHFAAASPILYLICPV